MLIDPCIPAEWNGFEAHREWRGAKYSITVTNPDHVEKGVKKIELNNKTVSAVPVQKAGTTNTVNVTMG